MVLARNSPFDDASFLAVVVGACSDVGCTAGRLASEQLLGAFAASSPAVHSMKSVTVKPMWSLLHVVMSPCLPRKMSSGTPWLSCKVLHVWSGFSGARRVHTCKANE